MSAHQLESVWNGRDSLTDTLERDYAACQGEGWDLIWEPTSPLTTPWEEIARLLAKQDDPNRHSQRATATKSLKVDGREAIQLFRNEAIRQIVQNEMELTALYVKSRNKFRKRGRRR